MTTAADSKFGSLLKQWRKRHGISQLALALDAGVSPRHLSFLESGRARPGRDMVLRLARVLELKTVDTNALLMAAGCAPTRIELPDMNASEIRPVRYGLESLLEKHRPFPALVKDQHHNILLSNEPTRKILQLILGQVPEQLNVLDLIFDPAALRPHLTNWDAIAAYIIRQLRRDQLQSDNSGLDLVERLKKYGEIPEASVLDEHTPILTFRVRIGDQELSLATMLTLFGSPIELTAQELVIETFFPTDQASEEFLKQLDPRPG